MKSKRTAFVKDSQDSQKKKNLTQSQRLRELQNEQAARQREYTRKKKKIHNPRTSQETICYRSMYEDGICDVDGNVFSATIRISDINYESALPDDQVGIFKKYCEILNSLDPEMPFQLTIINRKLDEEEFRNTILIPLADDGLDKYRKEMNEMLLDKVLKGKNNIIQDKFITFSGTFQDYFEAVTGLTRIETEISQSFKQLGCVVSHCDGKERLKIMCDMLRPNDDFNYDYSAVNDLPTKDYVSPMYFDFSDKSSFEYDGVVAQTLLLKDLPAELSDTVIARLTERPINMTVNLHLHSIAQTDALEIVNKKIMYMDKQKSDEIKRTIKNHKGVYDDSFLSYEVRNDLEQAEQLRDDLRNNGQSMFKATIVICVWANSAIELSDNVMTLMSIAKSCNCILASLDYRQLEGLNSSLPLGKNFVPIERTLTTASTAIFIPFTNQELLDPHGLYYGTSAKSGNLVVFDRTAQKVGNGMIFGTPGSGKSFAAKIEMIQSMLTYPDDVVIIVDPEREYSTLAENFGGTVVKIAAGGANHVNPFDFSSNYDKDDPMAFKAEFILSIVELVLGDGAATGAGHFRSIVDRSVRLCYSDYIKSGYDKQYMPTLKTFYEVLKQQPEREADDIALSLEVYTTGSLDIFAHETNVDLDKRLIVYDLKDLGNQLKPLGMMIVLDSIWNRITENRYLKRRTRLYIDEMQLLLVQHSCAQYFSQIYSRARKWGAIPTGITQNIETVLESDIARKMISNSDFILMLNQNGNDRVALQNLLGLSDAQMNYVHNSPSGQGLLYSSKGVVPFINKFPVDTELYKMITTKFGE